MIQSMKTEFAPVPENAEAQRTQRLAEKEMNNLLRVSLRPRRLCVKLPLAALLLCVLALMPSASPAATNELTALLQQGLFEEQANRNLDAAIADYQSLAAQFDKDRQLAATAIFRLGECYRMQGKTNEAALEYQRIVNEFPDQTPLVTLSRQNLPGLGPMPAAAAPSENSAAKLWDKVKNLPQTELEKVLPTLVPDATLTQLLQQRDSAETKLAQLRVDYSTNYPDYQREDAVLKTVNRQISEKIDGILQALKMRAELPQTAVAASTPSTDEDQEIQRIQTMIQNSPDLINATTDGNTPLTKAAYNGWLKVATFLLDHGANVNVKAQGNPPLNRAAMAGNRAMVELLLSRGADVNAKDFTGTTPLDIAVQKGFEAVAEVLLANHADVNARRTGGATALCLAASSGQLKIVQMLLAAGANPNLKDDHGETPLNYAIGSGPPEIFQALLAAGTNPNTEDSVGRTPLSYAAEKDSSEVVKLLLAAKADPNGGKRDAPLLCAIHQNDVKAAEMLLQSGANPNAKGVVDFSIPNNSRGVTPLYAAVLSKQFPMVQLLLKFKADPNDSQTDGRPLIFSALSHLDILAALLDAGADPNRPDKIMPNAYQGDSPLMSVVGSSFYETAEGNLAAAKLLIAHGANPNFKNAAGNTALHYAVNVGNLELVRLLLDNKADPNAENNNGTTPLAYAKANQNGIPAGPLGTATGADIAALLRQRGALDVLPDWDRITVSRPSAKYSAAIFFKGTNDWNQFTLFDLLGVQYDLLTASTASASRGSRLRVAPYGAGSPGMENPLTFPDFTRIIIHRPSAEGTNWNELKINLARSLDSGDCAGDVPLQFGDVVEIPEADHVINEFWTGLSTNELFTLKSCLTRHLQITVNGQTTNIIVAPQVWELVPGSREYPLSSLGAIMPPEVGMLKFEPLMMWPVLENSKLLLASSDLSRVIVKRRDVATGRTREWTVDCSNPNSPPAFWLRDGDVIEVPGK